MNPTPEQQQAIETVGAHISVSAGAGSGKTMVLVERILHLLKTERVELSEIVAITFTRKAASEMKERLRKVCYANTPDDDSEETNRWRGYLHQIDSARITTIDTFCSGMLREYGLWMQDDPDYAVMSDADAKLVPKRIAEETISALLNRGDTATELIAATYGMSQCIDMVVSQLEKPNVHAKLMAYAEGTIAAIGAEWQETLRAHLESSIDTFLKRIQALEGAFGDVKHVYAAYRVQLQQVFDAVQQGLPAEDLLPLLRDAAKTSFKGAQYRKAFDAGEYEDLKNVAKEGNKFIASFLLPYYSEMLNPESATLTHALAQVYREVYEAYRKHKRSNSLKDFSDLLRDAVDLLSTRPEIREQIAGGIRYLMIDEFQDTNPAQWSLAQQLMRTETQTGAELFIVGDVKQSIYRFRNADVSVFRDAQQDTAAPILLNTNFRTLPDVMNGINHFFAESGLLENVVCPWDPLGTNRPGVAKTRVEFILNVPPGLEGQKSFSVYEKRRTEAVRIADHVAAMCRPRSKYQIQEENKETGVETPRDVDFRDVALLFRTKSSMYLYENALKAMRIPFVTLGGSSFFYRQEIADLTNLLRALLDPWDAHALLGFLRSPMVGLDDNSVVHLGWRKGLAQEFYGTRPLENPTQQARLATAREWMQEFRANADKSIAELMRLILVRTNYEAVLLGILHGEQRVSNVRKMMDTARAMTQSGKSGLAEFVRYLDEQSSPGVLEGDAPLMGEMRNAVTLMTIHGSKGLEFPVVILPDTSSPPKSGGNEFHVESHARYGIAVKPPTKETANPAMFTWMSERNKEEDRDEDARVLYVAMTRARDYLVVSGSVDEKLDDDGAITREISDKSWLGTFDGVFGLLESLNSGELVNGIGVYDKPHGGGALEDMDDLAQTTPSLKLTQIESIERTEKVTPYVSVSAWLDERFASAEHAHDTFSVSQQMALARGTLVHRYLELWDFSKEKALEVNAFLSREYPQFREDVEWIEYLGGVAKALRASEIYGVLNDEGPLRRELPLLVSLEGRWISGTIDVLTHANTIVDYKTGAYRAESLGRYEMQLTLYADAVERLSGNRPSHALLYFVDSGQVHRVDVSGSLFSG